MIGKVWIIGAGSEAGLITVKGLRALREAQVLVYDDLLDHALLDEARGECEKICVGKRKNSHKKEQEEIHALLIDRARAGLQVVRLKGGDPTVFGRGGEEALALEEAGIPYEMIPGVSSCISAPEHFGISITQRGLASSFTVVTGHGDGKTAESFEALAALRGTLVFLMGHSRAGEIADGLMQAGMDPGTPASVLSRVFMPGEKRVDGCLRNLSQIAGEVQAPAVIVIGRVAQMHMRSPEAPAKAETSGAQGRRALVVGTKSFTSRMSAALLEDGMGVLEFPCVEIIPRREEIPQEQEFGDYDWLVFTSANGVKIFLEEIDRRDRDIRKLADMKIACIGPGTAAALKKAHLYADLMPETYTTQALAQALIQRAAPEEKILILRAQEGSPVLTQELKKEKRTYRDCKIYRAQYSSPAGSSERRASCDLVIFASAGGARGYLENNELSQDAEVVCIGSLTAAEFERLTGRKAKVANSCSVEGIRQCVLSSGYPK